MQLNCLSSDNCYQRHRKNSLIKQIWRQRPHTDSYDFDLHIRTVLKSILKHLTVESLETLRRCLTLKNKHQESCVMLDTTRTDPDPPPSEPHVIFCRVYRWNDLDTVATPLRKLPICSSVEEHSKLTECNGICLNPYHWSKVYKHPVDDLTEFRDDDDKLRLYLNDETDENTTLHSMETGQSTSWSSFGASPWCRLAYFELRDHLGEWIRFSDTSVDISSEDNGDSSTASFLLKTLHQRYPPRNSKVSQVRTRIGRGFTLELDVIRGHVWMYNRSNYDLFVSVPTIKSSGQPIRVTQDSCALVYDQSRRLQTKRCLEYCTEVDTISISFKKCWGSNYSRQDVINCECWLICSLHL